TRGKTSCLKDAMLVDAANGRMNACRPTRTAATSPKSTHRPHSLTTCPVGLKASRSRRHPRARAGRAEWIRNRRPSAEADPSSLRRAASAVSPRTGGGSITHVGLEVFRRSPRHLLDVVVGGVVPDGGQGLECPHGTHG